MESCHADDDDNKQEEESSSLLEKCVSSRTCSSDEHETAHQHEHYTPFEWLTNLESLDNLLLLALETSTNTTNSSTITNTSLQQQQQQQRARVMDVGCGSSILGEYLLEHPTLSRLVSQVVNVDKDKTTLHAMEKRWKQKTKLLNSSLHNRLLFLPPIDFITQSIPCPPPLPSDNDNDGSSSQLFHLIIDKSTLDCTLCTDHAATALICQVHSLLRPDNGVYLIISFHHVDFLRLLLQNCPGTNWELSFHVIHREKNVVETKNDDNNDDDILHNNGRAVDVSSAWSSGCFNPNESYRRTVNAVLCRRRGSCEDQQSETTTTSSCDEDNILDRNAVYQHINDTIEQWYRFQNPLLTETRCKELEQAFLSCSCQDNGEEKHETKLHHTAAAQQQQQLDLPNAFIALFTPAEREHLTYEHFLEDWHAFHELHPELPVDMLSYETAVAFLQVMQ